ncbi:hypothetical protein phiAS5_ORF0278 [Aeromonas phage phiAS5]|uniref:Uncharacterized protein n=1 Tax=Aeromonas phage phiAS5 TaxID=879630 RepID=E1A232_9CAUD|nr:hypothetical protein phiAS5_ORF0278 [Aeromonas phage phiAS5]ADM80121.1 hypothetical protein phiAS5_ORF0278 [Aeromonas phage phiAS5]BES53116.1 hypothetical protein [Aeromonas phage phiWae14]
MITKATNYLVELLTEKGYVFRVDDIMRGVGEPKNIYLIHRKDEDSDLCDVRYYDLSGIHNGNYLGRVPLRFMKVLESENTILVDYAELDTKVYPYVHIRAIASSSGVKVETTKVENRRTLDITISHSLVVTVAAVTVEAGEESKHIQKVVDMAANAYYDRVCKELEQETKDRLAVLKIKLKMD